MPPALLPAVEHVLALAREAATAPGLEPLAAISSAARQAVAPLLAEGGGSRQTARLLSLVHDRVAARVIELMIPRFRLPPAEWCWLSMGSEGRHEQTLATDQDNGMAFSAGSAGEADELRAHFLPFAEAVNAALAECGMPLCCGNVMAGNPQWCLSADEWREHFAAWIKIPEPDALLAAAIFFDFRGLFGACGLAERLRAEVLSLTAGNEAFLRMMGANALAATPPLGVVRDFATDKGADGRIDLKKFGARLFVDAARILALDAGHGAVDTAGRLRAAAAAGRLPAGDAEAALAAFDDVQRLRLAGQLDALRCQRPVDSRIDPDRLDDYDRRVLLEALRQARHLQHRLKTTYHIEG